MLEKTAEKVIFKTRSFHSRSELLINFKNKNYNNNNINHIVNKKSLVLHPFMGKVYVAQKHKLVNTVKTERKIHRVIQQRPFILSKSLYIELNYAELFFKVSEKLLNLGCYF